MLLHKVLLLCVIMLSLMLLCMLVLWALKLFLTLYAVKDKKKLSIHAFKNYVLYVTLRFSEVLKALTLKSIFFRVIFNVIAFEVTFFDDAHLCIL